MENATSVLTAAWTEITGAVTAISGNDFAKLGVILFPLAATALGIAKGMFRSRGRR